MKPNFSLSADSIEDLLQVLKQIDIRVGPVIGRTTQHRERYVMARFLATMASVNLLRYPLKLVHGDGPDFVFWMQSEQIAIECVEAVATESYAIRAIRERKYPKAWRSIPTLRAGENLLTAADKDQFASSERREAPLQGDMPEQLWADAMEHFIRDKTTKLRAGNYAGSPKTWLLIQDEYSAVIDHDEELEEAMTICLPRIEPFFDLPCFDSIFILNRGQLLTLERNSFSRHPLCDLWN
jgi:hypothetical protein